MKPKNLGTAIVATISVTMLSTAAISAHASEPGAGQARAVVTPENILAAGEDTGMATNPYTGEVNGPIRKGTIGSTIANTPILNRLLLEPKSPELEAKIKLVTDQIEKLIPSLTYFGVFDFFTADEWISNKQPGRTLIALLYLKHYPEKLTHEVSAKLKKSIGKTKSAILDERIKALVK